jgi:hypothetical protein
MVGASIAVVGGAVVQVVQASTTVSDQMVSYPWSSDALAPIESLWAIGQLLLVVVLIGFRRSGLAGPTRTARLGLTLAVVGATLIFFCELALIPLGDQRLDDTAPVIDEATFGLATLLLATGLILVGKTTVKARLWRDWRRFTPLAAGIWTVVMIGLQLTKLLPTSVAIYGLCFFALSYSLYTRPSTHAEAAHPLLARR